MGLGGRKSCRAGLVGAAGFPPGPAGIVQTPSPCRGISVAIQGLSSKCPLPAAPLPWSTITVPSGTMGSAGAFLRLLLSEKRAPKNNTGRGGGPRNPHPPPFIDPSSPPPH